MSISSLILLFAGLSMFFIQRTNKIVVIIFTVFCLTALDFPFKIPMVNGAVEFVSWCFIISEFRNFIACLRGSKSETKFIVLFTAIIGIIVSWFHSPYFGGIYGLFQLLKNGLLDSYLLLYLTNTALEYEDSKKKVPKAMFMCLLMLTAFGLLNLVLHRNYFVDFALRGHGSINDYNALGGDRYAFSERFRVNSMFLNAFNYGYACVILLIYFIYQYLKSQISLRRLYIVISCTLFGIIFCGARTNILCFLVAIVIFLACYYKLSKMIVISIFTFVALFIVVVSVPKIREKTDFLMSVFDDDSDVVGSSISLRGIQYAAVASWVQGYEVFGRGVEFAKNDLMIGGDKSLRVDQDLQSLEGVVLKTILEKGIFGVVVFFVIYIILLHHFIKLRKDYKLAGAYGITLVIVFLVFSNATGVLMSDTITLLMIGILLNEELT